MTAAEGENVANAVARQRDEKLWQTWRTCVNRGSVMDWRVLCYLGCAVLLCSTCTRAASLLPAWLCFQATYADDGYIVYSCAMLFIPRKQAIWRKSSGNNWRRWLAAVWQWQPCWRPLPYRRDAAAAVPFPSGINDQLALCEITACRSNSVENI